jgi:hypothetical protein
MNPKHWSVEQVLEWLKSLNISNDYIPTFKCILHLFYKT